jgi:serine/threonine protein kinase
VAQIAKGLHAFHRKEMLHQDLKPENIMIGKQGNVKIIDFGSVKIAGIVEIAPLDINGEDNVLGTLNYTAPEYHLNQRGTIKSDLYSLAVITYEMLNGSLPFNRDVPDKPNTGFFASRQYIPSIQRNPMVPTWIDRTLKKALATNPQLRYDDIPEFIYDLNHPNQAYLRTEDFIPLMQRNPLRFWQSFSLILVVINVILLYFLVS